LSTGLASGLSNHLITDYARAEVATTVVYRCNPAVQFTTTVRGGGRKSLCGITTRNRFESGDGLYFDRSSALSKRSFGTPTLGEDPVAMVADINLRFPATK